MSATNVDLGNVEYVYLRNSECNNGAGADGTNVFQWTMPYINPKESPYMFIQVVQLYVDHDDGAGAALPQNLVFNNINGLNSYSTGGSQLASLMQRDAPAGHWSCQQESPMIQVSTNINTLSFSIVNNITNAPITLGTAGSFNILLKIVRPKREEITNNTLASYVRTMA